MGQFAWTEQVSTISSMLHTLEDGVGRGDMTAASGLEDFKSALDDLRLRAWGLLMAINADDHHGFQERFRIRRGKDMCRALVTDLGTGKLSGRHPDLPELGATARDLASAVEQAQGRGKRRSSQSKASKRTRSTGDKRASQSDDMAPE